MAWISLDSGDNDPIRFWRYMITACQRFYADSGHASLAQLLAGLSSAFELPSLDAVLTLLLNALARSECAGLLVLEDYHMITEARIHETLIKEARTIKDLNTPWRISRATSVRCKSTL